MKNFVTWKRPLILKSRGLTQGVKPTTMSTASKPLLAQTAANNNLDGVSYTYGATSPDADLQARESENAMLCYSTQSVDDLSLGLSPEKAKALQDKALKLRGQNPLSNSETFMHFVKANVGPGMLALPKAMKQSGLVIGPILLLVIGLCMSYCMYLLVKCSHTLSKRLHVRAMDYGDTAFVATLPFSKKWAVYFRFGRHIKLTDDMMNACKL
jgi:hypothetical protein